MKSSGYSLLSTMLSRYTLEGSPFGNFGLPTPPLIVCNGSLYSCTASTGFYLLLVVTAREKYA